LRGAADVVDGSGEPYIQIVDARGTENRIGGHGTIDADVMLLVRATSDPKSPVHCRSAAAERCDVMRVLRVPVSRVALIAGCDAKNALFEHHGIEPVD
jgi:hypothetical protein